MAYKTICKSGWVYAVKSDIAEKHENKFIGGYNFNCKMEDVRKALREHFYYNYNLYLSKAYGGREWVQQYHGKCLKKNILHYLSPVR